MRNYAYEVALKNRSDLQQFGGNALALFALQLFFQIEDVTTIGADDSIVDGPDDGGLDIVYINRKGRYAVVSQNYMAIKKKYPPSAKVRDLSSGLTLLLKSPIGKVPLRLQSAAKDIRSAIKNREIQKIHIWFVHNCPGSVNVKSELEVVESTAHSLLKNDEIECSSCEISADEIEKTYTNITTHIKVKDKFKVPISDGVSMNGNNWKAFITSVPLYWLFDLFKKYEDRLFTANVRDYLGVSKKSIKNINNGIKETATNDPDHFWVFNNGITVLVNSFKKNKKELNISGFSILNGAQTTGAIGNLIETPDKKAWVQVRFVQCSHKQTIDDIKKFNNSQNKIEPSDYKSSDQIQNRLEQEFIKTDVHYLPRRGGTEDLIKRKPNTLQSILAGQILAAFHQRPDIAYHQKTKIWEDDSLYREYFNTSLNAKNLIFVYSLFEAVKNRKLLLVKKSKLSELSKTEKEQLQFFQTRGSIFLFTSALANCLEIILDRPISNPSRLHFNNKLSFGEMVKAWTSIVNAGCYSVSRLNIGFSDGAVREHPAKTAIKDFTDFIGATREVNKQIYSDFSKKTDQ